MKARRLLPFFAGFVCLAAVSYRAFPAQDLSEHAYPSRQDVTPEAGGDHLRIETEHGPIHFWRPEKYDPHTAGTVIYVHGYFTSVDQAWTDQHLASQFDESDRNALFIAIEAPQSGSESVYWKSLDELLAIVEDFTPFSLPHGPLVVEGHSGAYRTILLWLPDARVQYLVLLDAMYGGQAEFRSWLRARPSAKAHRIVLVSSDTWRQSNRFARPVPGTVRRRNIPVNASNFTRQEARAHLLSLRSQYDHDAIVSSGKVIPVLLAISPLKGLTSLIAQPTKRVQPKPLALAK